jgi:acyl carrier protein phosphodiesterase
MNWLAHVFLSADSVEFQLGNLLADLVRGPARESMSPAFRNGAECHREIDRFTDAHPVVRRSRARLSARHRRFSGVLVDVFYDHLLARIWARYASVSLDQFTQSFHAATGALPLGLPDEAAVTLDRIRKYDLLGAYRNLGGVQASLRRLSMGLQARWKREFFLDESVTELQQQLTNFQDDFDEFFPALIAHIDARWPIEHLAR